MLSNTTKIQSVRKNKVIIIKRMEGTVENDSRNSVNCNVWMDSGSGSHKLKNICETVWEI